MWKLVSVLILAISFSQFHSANADDDAGDDDTADAGDDDTADVGDDDTADDDTADADADTADARDDDTAHADTAHTNTAHADTADADTAHTNTADGGDVITEDADGAEDEDIDAGDDASGQFGGLPGAGLPGAVKDTAGSVGGQAASGLLSAGHSAAGIAGEGLEAVGIHVDVEQAWKDFEAAQKLAGKTFTAAQKAAFEGNGNLVNKFNEGATDFFLKLNDFAYLTLEEFKKKLLGFKANRRSILKITKRQAPPPGGAEGLPAAVDWRNKSVVTPIKNQGECGSCWTFSTTGAVEGQLSKKLGKLVSLSEQNLVDCVYKPESGCDGGDYNDAFAFIQTQGGINTEESYPYNGTTGATCNFDKTKAAGTTVGHVAITAGSEEELKKAVATIGPISIAVSSGNPSFQLYAAGIYQEPLCKGQQVDHAMLLVGYGTNVNGTDYWIIKNSFGKTWGMNGYMHLLRGTNECGVATMASYPTV